MSSSADVGVPVDVSWRMSACTLRSGGGGAGVEGGGGDSVFTFAVHVPVRVSHSDGLTHGGLHRTHTSGGGCACSWRWTFGRMSVHSNDTIVRRVDIRPRGLERLRLILSLSLRIVVSALHTAAATNYDSRSARVQSRRAVG